MPVQEQEDETLRQTVKKNADLAAQDRRDSAQARTKKASADKDSEELSTRIEGMVRKMAGREKLLEDSLLPTLVNSKGKLQLARRWSMKMRAKMKEN